MILYCHRYYADFGVENIAVEDISGEDFIEAMELTRGEFGFGDLVYVGY